MKELEGSLTKSKAQPEKKRVLVMWFIIGAIMLVIFSLWVLSLDLKPRESRPNPELEEMRQDLEKTLEELERSWQWIQQTKIKESARELKNNEK